MQCHPAGHTGLLSRAWLHHSAGSEPKLHAPPRLQALRPRSFSSCLLTLCHLWAQPSSWGSLGQTDLQPQVTHTCPPALPLPPWWPQPGHPQHASCRRGGVDFLRLHVPPLLPVSFSARLEGAYALCFHSFTTSGLLLACWSPWRPRSP